MRTMPIDHHAVDEIETMTTPTPIRSQVMPKARTWNGFYKLARPRTNNLRAQSTDRHISNWIIIFFGENYWNQEPIHMIV